MCAFVHISEFTKFLCENGDYDIFFGAEMNKNSKPFPGGHNKTFFFVFITFALCWVILKPFCFSAYAIETDSPHNSFNYTVFSDVKSSDWFYEDVTKLCEKGILNGYPDGSFRPHTAVSRAEIVKLVTVTLGLEPSASFTGNEVKVVFSDVADKSLWFYGNVGAALSGGLLFAHEFDGSEFLPHENVTRADAAKFICRGLDVELIPYSSPFSDTENIYAIALFSVGIMNGSINADDGKRVFEPDAPLTRAECCAVISRIIDFLKNKDEYISKVQKTLGDELVISQSPKAVEEFYVHLERMFKNGIFSARFSYKDYPFGSAGLDTIKKNYLSAFSAFYSSRPEYASLFVTRVSTSGNSLCGFLNVEIDTPKDFGISREQLSELSEKAKEKAKAVLSSVILPGFSPKQKADAIHDFIISNASYDTSGSFRNTSYLSYGVLLEGVGVCQGYAAAFNVMCGLSGLRSYAVSDGAHMWNVVMLDGQAFVYDTTWDDPVPDIPQTYENKFRGIPLSLADSDGTHRAFLFYASFVF